MSEGRRSTHVSHSSCVGNAVCHARNSARNLGRAFDEGDFFGREFIEFINELVNLPVGGGDGVLQRRPFLLRRRRPQLRR